MMNQIAEEAKKVGLGLGICGELGTVEEFLPLWVAMGYEKLSGVPGRILKNRSKIAGFNFSDAQTLLTAVLKAEDETEVRDLLKRD